ncbi:MAG TPA: TIGR02300 family protein [Rhizomicrobium sp.]|jgi:uncharacterized protein (TIGR02300 family)
MKLAKADLGQKRVCPSCQARFYDLQKRPIECPKCHFAFEPESLFKQRRTRQPEAVPVVGAAAVVEEADEEQEAEEAENEEAEGVEAEPVVLTGDEDDEEEAATEEEEAEGAGMSVVEGEPEDIEDIEVEEEDDADAEPLLEEVEEDGDDVAGILDPGVTKDER